MKWTPGRMALVTAVGFLALVGVGVNYVLNADPDQTSLARAVPVESPSASGSTAAPTPSAAVTAPPGTDVELSDIPTIDPDDVSPSTTAEPEPPPTLDFTLSSFNVLGASHTSGGGRRPGMASGRVRAGHAAAIISRHRSDVVGFQELQAPQLATLQRQTNMDFYPGFSMRRRDTENSIGWRRDQWVAIEKHTVNIPYFNGGARAMPFVKLRSRSTGLEAWFANFHNPAETAQYHRQQRFRNRATAIEKHLANQLINGTGLPVFITGDMNERGAYFCRLTSGSPMIAARGGTNNGRCLPGRPRAVDWIFGSQGVVFTDYFEDRSHLVDITTDHPVISARVRITGKASGDLTGTLN